MHNGNTKLRTDHGAGRRGVDIAHHYDSVRPMYSAHRLVGNHGAAGLLGVGAAAHFKMMGGLGKGEVGKERIGHVRVVVLSGVHDLRAAPVRAGKFMVERRDLHEIGSRGRDQVHELRIQTTSPPREPARKLTPPMGSAQSSLRTLFRSSLWSR